MLYLGNITLLAQIVCRMSSEELNGKSKPVQKQPVEGTPHKPLVPVSSEITWENVVTVLDKANFIVFLIINLISVVVFFPRIQ